jgi:NhaA family Na+:H+ antiporter
MGTVQRKLTQSFHDFLRSEQSSGVLLIVCTVVSLLLANSVIGENYLSVWHAHVGGLSVEQWVNDGLMAVFFLFIGLELERELYSGELSDFKNALLPIVAAGGGIVVPALIHFSLNAGTPTQAGMGIPMATDIAFALGALALLGKRVPASLKVFLAALAVIDDLGAIIVIAVFYTAKLSIAYLLASLAVFGVLLVINRYFRVVSLVPYLLGGVLMWYLMLRSGVHATIAGVLLAFTIPYSAKEDDESSPSHKLEQLLNFPVAFIILPIFALANTGIIIGRESLDLLVSANSFGIGLGLFVGKPIGIFLASFAAVAAGLCRLPLDLAWRHIFGAGLLGGIGFTMSIFITNLAFAGNTALIDESKLVILLASLCSGIVGFLWLRSFGQPLDTDEDMDTMDFASPD